MRFFCFFMTLLKIFIIIIISLGVIKPDEEGDAKEDESKKISCIRAGPSLLLSLVPTMAP